MERIKSSFPNTFYFRPAEGQSHATLLVFNDLDADCSCDRFQHYHTKWLKVDMNVVILKDPHEEHFTGGIDPSKRWSIKQTLTFLRKILTMLDTHQVVTVGSSAGGYAALLYGILLNADFIWAVNPQTECMLTSTTWSQGLENVEETERHFLDLGELVQTFSHPIEIVYGNRDAKPWRDKRQAQYMRKCNRDVVTLRCLHLSDEDLVCNWHKSTIVKAFKECELHCKEGVFHVVPKED